MPPVAPAESPDSYDLIVYGATAAGIVCAVRAAREGRRVLLTHHLQHIGGLMANGLMQWDALSDHRRCPLFRELLARATDYYRETYGPDSEEAAKSNYDWTHYPLGMVEPRVIEGIFDDLVAAESTLTLWRGWHITAARREGRRVREIDLREHHGEGRRTVRGRVFVDASYEGDLAARAGIACHIGREGREVYGEPHAGHVMTRVAPSPPHVARPGEAWIRQYGTGMGGIDPASTGAGDRHIQAYNCRPCLTDIPANRLMIEQQPERYDRDDYLTFTRRYLAAQGRHQLNGKGTYNSPILPGENWDYPEGDWATRDRITQRHQDFAVGYIWFLQNDLSVDAERREQYRRWGLPLDEFTDHGHLPWEMYVRETRRIIGRHVLTELDLTPQGTDLRPRCFADSVGFTDWYMDSHSCSRDGTWGPAANPEYPYDGKLLLTEKLAPGMIPWRSLLPQEVDNVIVPVCLSSSHIAWGAVRLEPVWVQLGEVAGIAAGMALAKGIDPAALSVADLQRRLLADQVAIAFMNQHATAADRLDYAEQQLAACHGEHDSFDLT